MAGRHADPDRKAFLRSLLAAVLKALLVLAVLAGLTALAVLYGGQADARATARAALAEAA